MAKDGEIKRHVVTMRMSEALRTRISDAAKANGRSVSQEIESRLEMSFQEERILGGPRTALLTKLIASVVALIELETERPWDEDRMTWEAVNAAVSRLLTAFQPSLDFDIWDKHRERLLWFMEPVWGVANSRREIEGLSKAYPTRKDVPSEIRPRLKAAWDKYEKSLAEAKKRAESIFSGPLRDHEERKAEAVKLGRTIAGDRAKGPDRTFTIAGLVRMSPHSGAFEPLPGMNASLSMEELHECLLRLAGSSHEDPEMDADNFLAKRPHWLGRDDESIGGNP